MTLRSSSTPPIRDPHISKVLAAISPSLSGDLMMATAEWNAPAIGETLRVSEVAYAVVREGERFVKAILARGDDGQSEQTRQLFTQFRDTITASFDTPAYLSVEDLRQTLASYKHGKSCADWELDLPTNIRFRELVVGVFERVSRAYDTARQRADELKATADKSKKDMEAQRRLQRRLGAVAKKLYV